MCVRTSDRSLFTSATAALTALDTCCASASTRSAMEGTVLGCATMAHRCMSRQHTTWQRARGHEHTPRHHHSHRCRRCQQSWRHEWGCQSHPRQCPAPARIAWQPATTRSRVECASSSGPRPACASARLPAWQLGRPVLLRGPLPEPPQPCDPLPTSWPAESSTTKAPTIRARECKGTRRLAASHVPAPLVVVAWFV